MAIFSCHYVKLIILKNLMSLLVYYVSELFLFGALSFKSFTLIIDVFKIYHSGHFLSFKSFTLMHQNETIMKHNGLEVMLSLSNMM